MTIATTLNRIEYTATASQTVFPYTFLIFLNTDLEVYINGTLQTLTTHYTVSGLGDITGGNVTLVTGAAVNDAIIIVRVLPLTQLTDYVENDSFPADTHEKGLDRATMVSQQLLETLGRAIKLPITSTLEDIDIPVPGAGKHLAWNSGGTALELVTVSEAAIASPVSTKGDIIQGDSSGDAERLAIGTSLQFARVSSGGKVEWTSEPITTKGDIVRGDTAAGEPERLAIGTNGKVLQAVSGQVAWANVKGLKSVQVFTSSGTWTKPSGIVQVKATVVGGGGGGAGGQTTEAGSGGGGGGAAIELLDVTGTASEAVTIGAGGAGGAGNNDGVAGGTSSLGSLLSATGGGKGITNAGAPGLGGAGAGGDINLNGGDGVRGLDTLQGGMGGNSSIGGGGAGGTAADGANAGKNHGGGGGGAKGANNGGAGAAGIVIIWEYE